MGKKREGFSVWLKFNSGQCCWGDVVSSSLYCVYTVFFFCEEENEREEEGIGENGA